MSGTVRIVVAGGSGFLGRALVHACRNDGHEVKVLTRRPGPAAADDVRWDPGSREGTWTRDLEHTDAVVNLAGEGIADAARIALANAQRRASEVDYICAWGPGHRAIDANESTAMRRIFGDRLPELAAAEMRGYVRARAVSIIAAETDRLIDQEGPRVARMRGEIVTAATASLVETIVVQLSQRRRTEPLRQAA